MKHKKKFFILSLGLLLTLIACNSDKDIVASYKNGNVLRGDLRSYYKIFGMDANPQTMSIEYQTNVIQEIAVQNIVFEKFKDISEEEYNTILDLTKQQFQVSLYRKSFMDKQEKKGKIEMADIQLLVIKDAEKEKEKVSRFLTELNNLKDSEKIANYIAINTDESSRKCIGGLLEPVCLNCGDDPLKSMFEEGINKKDKKFYMIVNGPNAYIYRILRTKEMTLDHLADFMKKKFVSMNKKAKSWLEKNKDEKSKQEASYYSGDQFKESAISTSDHYKKKKLNAVWSEKMIELQKNSGLKINEAVMTERNLNDGTILYTDKNGKPFTLGDLSKDYDKLASLNNNLDKTKLMQDKLGFFYQLYLPYLIISSAEDFNKIKDSDLYKDGLDILKKSIVWKYKQRKLLAQNIDITEKELQDTYNAGKMYAYSTQDATNPSKRNPMPYASVREKIKNELMQSKKTQLLQDFIQKVEKDYSLVINSKELKAGKI